MCFLNISSIPARNIRSFSYEICSFNKIWIKSEPVLCFLDAGLLDSSSLVAVLLSTKYLIYEIIVNSIYIYIYIK